MLDVGGADKPPPADISFVIPTFSRTDLLRDTVASVLQQTRSPREILVVDNGEQDAAALALAEFGDAVTRVRAPSKGVQQARNLGLQQATSTWVALLDDDDLLLPNYVAEIEHAMAVGPADVIGTDHHKFTDGSIAQRTNMELAPPDYWEGMPFVVVDSTKYFHGKFPLDRLLRRIPFYPSMTVIRREFALAIGGYDDRVNGIMSEDVEFLLRALSTGRLTLIFKPLVRYRLHSGNNTADRHGRHFGRWRIFEFARTMHKSLPEEFIKALDQDLPERRVRIFDLSYGLRRYNVMRSVAPLLRPRDWTIRRRLHYAIGQTPPPLEKACRRFGAVIGGRSSAQSGFDKGSAPLSLD